jgi:hypothetical protein
MENENEPVEDVDALCPECGHAFKAYVDRMLGEDRSTRNSVEVSCPVCGCGECKVGK